MSADHLFVYGSLRVNSTARPSDPADAQAMEQARDAVNRFAEFSGPGMLQGYRFLDVSWYPGIVADESAHVHGDLFVIDNAGELLRILDAYEGCSAQCPRPHLYRREIVRVSRVRNDPVDAWVYVWNGAEPA